MRIRERELKVKLSILIWLILLCLLPLTVARATNTYSACIAFEAIFTPYIDCIIDSYGAPTEPLVSPVIATILMVAITVVLSGVIYVWASSLAETGKLGVPRVTFDIENKELGTADGYWAITVDQTEAELATAGVSVTVIYTNSDGVRTTYITQLSNTSDVYGFDPSNSDAFVTFVDKVEDEGSYKESTFGIGDQIFVRTHAPEDGHSITDATIRITYQPGAGEGSVIKTYRDLEFNKIV